MSGSGSTSWSEQLGALTFAIIMVASMVVPFVALGAGTATAAATGVTLVTESPVDTGQTVDIDITDDTSGGSGVTVFLDNNQNGVFDSDTDTILNSFAASGGTQSVQVTIPSDAPSGDAQLGAVQGSVSDGTSAEATSDSFFIATLAGTDDNSEVDYEVGGSGSQTLTLGQANNSVGLTVLEDISTRGAFSGTVSITLPKGVTVNTAASNLDSGSVTGTGALSGEISSVSVTDNDRTIEISLSATSNQGDRIRIRGGALVLNVDPTRFDSQGGGTVGLGTVSVQYAIGTLDIGDGGATDLFDGGQIGTTAPSGSLGVNDKGQALSAGSSFSLTVEPGEIGAGTDITVELDNRVRFDERIDGDDVIPGTGDIDGDGTAELNTSDVSVNGDTLSIGVSDPIDSPGTTIEFDLGFDQSLSTTGTASGPLSAGQLVVTTSTNEPVILNEDVDSGDAPGSINVVAQGTVSAERLDTFDFTGDSTAKRSTVATGSTTSIGTDSITLTTSSDESASLVAGDILAVDTDGSGDVDSADTFLIVTDVAGTAVTVVGASGSSFSEGDQIFEITTLAADSSTGLSVSSSKTIDATDPIRFNVTGTATDPNIDVTVEASAVSTGPFLLNDNDEKPTFETPLSIEKPSFDLSGSSTLALGADGQQPGGSLTLDTSTGGVSVGAGDVVNFTLTSSSFNFDQRDVPTQAEIADSSAVTEEDIESVTVTGDAISVQLASDATSRSATDAIEIESTDYSVNVTDTAPTGTTVALNVTVNAVVTVEEESGDGFSAQKPSLTAPSGSIGVGQTGQTVGQDLTLGGSSPIDTPVSTVFTDGTGAANKAQLTTSGTADGDGISSGDVLLVDGNFVLAAEDVSSDSAPGDDSALDIAGDGGTALSDGSAVNEVSVSDADADNDAGLDASSASFTGFTGTLTLQSAESSADDIVVGDVLFISAGDTDATGDTAVVVVKDSDPADNTVTVVSASSGGPTVNGGDNILIAEPGDSAVSSSQSNDLAVSGTQEIAFPTGTVVISANNSAVTFDQRLTKTGVVDNFGGGLRFTENASESITVSSDGSELRIQVTDTTGADGDESVQIDFNGGSLSQFLNVSADAQDGTEVVFNATTQNGGVDVGQSSTTVTLNKPDVSLTDDQTVNVDEEDTSGVDLSSDLTITSTEEGDLVAGDDSDDNAGNEEGLGVVQVRINGTGVSFDKSATKTNVIASTQGVQVRGGSDSKISITDDVLTIPIEENDAGGTEEIVLNLDGGELLNVSDSVANATDFEFTVTTTPDNSSGTFREVNTTVSQTTTIEVLEPDTVDTGSVEADTDAAEELDSAATTEDADAVSGVTETVQVKVQNTNKGLTGDDGVDDFGGAPVEFTLVGTPSDVNGSEVTAADFLNTTSTESLSNGLAQVNFTGTQTGVYKFNANASDTVDANFTVEVVSGEAAKITVTRIDDAIQSRSGDIGDAAVLVNVTDENGNLVTRDVDVSVIVDSASASVKETFKDRVIPDGEGTGPTADNLGDGTLTITDGQAVIELTNTETEDVTVSAEFGGNSDSATLTFFEPISQVEATANDTAPLQGDDVQVNATLLTSDGTVITVDQLSVSFDDNGNANTSLVSTSATTDDSGQASIVVNADDNGTSTIDAKSNLKQGSVTLNIDNPTLDVTLNTTEVEVDNETVVEANVTFANNGTAVEGATVNVTGAGVDVSDQTTPANGSVTFTVNASTADTITVEATKSDTNAGTATIEATPGIPPIGSASNSPTDPDGDGTFEDLNGNGEFDIGDVTVLFNEINDPAIQNNPDAFDFNGDGEVTTSDVTALFNEGVEQDEGTGGFGTTTETTQSLADGFTAISSESED